LEVVASVLRNFESENTLGVRWRVENIFNGLFCFVESYDLENLGGGGEWE